MISNDSLRESIEGAQKRARKAADGVVEAESALAKAERELRLLIELAEMRGMQLPEDVDLPARKTWNGGGETSGTSRRSTDGKENLLATVVDILSERGQPMQIRELMAAVQGRDVKIPGRGQQANLIAHISRDPRIVRPHRGYYGLAAWGLKGATSKSKAKRKRRRSGARQ